MKRGRMRWLLAAAVWASFVAGAAPAVVGGNGASLNDLAGTETLVTVVIKGSGATDQNLTIERIEGGVMTVVSQTGNRSYYKLDDVQEVRVQGEVVKLRQNEALLDRALTKNQQDVVTRAIERAAEIFAASSENQPLRMLAAEVLAAAGAPEARDAAVEYLKGLAAGNDMRTALDAAFHLYFAGVDRDCTDLVQRGLASGDRRVKETAAKLAGVLGISAVRPELHKMAQDRAANISAPAALALGLLGDHSAIPTLLTMITDQNQEKGEAAVFALTRLGGGDVIEQMKLKLPKAEGYARFRIIRVLFALGDPMGAKLLREEVLEVPSLQYEAALLLAEKGDLKALNLLRQRLGESYDPIEGVLIQRAEAVAALIRAGDRSQAGMFQELLSSDISEVKKRVLRLLSSLDLRTLLPVTLPAIQGSDATISALACRAAVAMANRNYRERLVFA